MFEKVPAVRTHVHYKNGFIFGNKEGCWGDGSHRMTILCFWSTQLDLKTGMVYTNFMREKGHEETKRGE